MLASGRATDDNYSANLESFDWQSFFANGGGNFLESLRSKWLNDFDVVMIDSRTGLSDSGGICTIQLPDILVGMFTANHQSLYGVRDVMRLAQRARQSLAYDRSQLSIIPLGSRFANDFRESKDWVERASGAMSEFYSDWLPRGANIHGVTDQLKIPHVDYFAYGEKLAVIEQGTSDPQGMGFTYLKVANLLAHNLGNAEEVFQLGVSPQTPNSPDRRPLESTNIRAASYDLYVSYKRDSVLDDWLRPFLKHLDNAISLRIGRPARIFFDYREIELGENFADQTFAALAKSKLLLAIVTPSYWASSWNLAEWETFERRERTGASSHSLILPLLSSPTSLPARASNRVGYDISKFLSNKTTEMNFDFVKFTDSLASEIVKALDAIPDFDNADVVSPGEVKVSRISQS
ncbi:toll/interleukin-1 receptor domain-containing protein [Bradyrhizobium sp. AUGA SZCCT0158]|uniref:toll/interleukin-1 receptor domain-containing protein n=1 Tax=Bradyrhizobium sp. AUGA SZCCT0158 TaxID=2807661 RepID=UPI001BA8AB33|nr:toll/interleukin-1 receptor domain-containing protein [Bradyrhizobium sp. AUGA SZCCT0158]MBR1199538.1 toll/interleukin-1 receptor domain-containing protein [Bradyrhizobium sp. AUGA SZCCT0158]